MSDRAMLEFALEMFLTTEGILPAGRILTHAVIVYHTRQANADGKDTVRRGRCYPLGEIDPTLERGMLDDALFDARKQRR
ncbi:hypothetical protein [Actinokineospora spheciospongiae]|uniref:hypothetical protein n=1 Tax=Actinokineospora spheciospongiae TaxID=909613 RepID=UPI000D712A91|nr:hypothetical protein [Actinokineospora spheciospongiae]PWW53128.1 hypothetical protein DFQ13_116118 [Actinokineospora spheciospongiae]